jgi:hypothetical protein
MTHKFGNLNIKLSNSDKIKSKIRQIKYNWADNFGRISHLQE